MEAIVLAGGIGSRLSSVLPGVPKGMAPIGGKPFLEILLSTLQLKGIRRIIFSLGHKAEVVQTCFGSTFQGMDLVYSTESSPLGTGGATRAAMPMALSSSVFIVNGDTLVDLDYQEMYRAHCAASAKASIAVSRVDDTARYGRIVVTSGRVTGFEEKKLSGVGDINTGVYLLNQGVFDPFDLPDAFSIESGFFSPHLAALNPLVYRTTGYFIDIGTPEDFARAQLELT
jgi:D-glycero-alpha-D-manno-heptose 1-phosphate guanylyltransferase